MAHRFETLDGMRGAAAMFVMFGHGSDFFDFAGLPHFWLAVDLFFMMSGFVLGRTYEPRFARGMSTGQFMLARVVRLYPLYALGTLLGFTTTGLALALGHGTLSPAEFASAAASAIFMLPAPIYRLPEFFPLDFPAWSLFAELIANLGFALVWRWLSNRVLVIWIIATGLLLLRFSNGGIVFSGNNWYTVHWGLLRVGLGFFAGVLLARLHPGTKCRSDLAWAAPIVTALLLTVVWPDLNGLTDALMVLIIFPTLIWFAALVEPVRPRPFGALGRISYPLYALHVPVLALLWRVLLYFRLQPQSYAPWLGFVCLSILIGLALFLDRRFDTPVRRWLLDYLSTWPQLFRRLTKRDTPL